MDHLSKYNNIDDVYRKKIVDFMNKEIDSIDISRKIEKSVYNYTINASKKKKN